MNKKSIEETNKEIWDQLRRIKYTLMNAYIVSDRQIVFNNLILKYSKNFLSCNKLEAVE